MDSRQYCWLNVENLPNFFDTAATLVHKAVQIKYVGGAFGGHRKPTPFLCLLMKLLLIQPEKEIVLEYLNNEDFKYIRCLAAMYIRLTMPSEDVYRYLERFYSDNRKITYRQLDGSYEKIYVDVFIDNLLREERYCDIILPRLTQRRVLEELGKLPPRISALALSDSESDDDSSDLDDSESDSESSKREEKEVESMSREEEESM